MSDRYVAGIGTYSFGPYMAAAICDTRTMAIYPMGSLENAEERAAALNSGEPNQLWPGVGLVFHTLEDAVAP